MLSILLGSAVLLFAGMPALAQITIEIKQANIKTIFRLIEKQADVKFSYNEHTIKSVPQLTLHIQNQSLTAALSVLEAKTDLAFSQVKSLIAVSRKAVPEPANSNRANTPPLTVSGRVIDEAGSPIAGATIKAVGSDYTTTTGAAGRFTLKDAEIDANLTVTFIGYEPQTVRASRDLVIRLFRSSSKLDEVQIIAYGTTTQRLGTGSVTTISGREIAQQPVGNSLAAVIGRVPGLIVTQDNGVPGSSFRLQVRGQNAISNLNKYDANSDPLIIIDGVPFAPNNERLNVVGSIASPVASQGLSPLNLINPADIESIEVLKDADATSIYGSRGAFGVILITTKKGKAGKTGLTANISSGVSQVAKKMEFMNTAQYLEIRQQALANDAVTPDNTNAYDVTLWSKSRYTDWQEEMIGRAAPYMDAQLSLSGGSPQTQFMLNGGFHHESTVFPGNLGYLRGSMHASLNHTDADKRFSVGLSINYAADKNNLSTTDLMQFILLPPNQPDFYDASGKLKWEDQGIVYAGNPYASLLNAYTAKSNNLLGNLQLSYKITDALSVRTSLGYNNVRVDEVSVLPASAINPLLAQNPGGSSQFGSNAYTSWIMEPQLEYRKTFGKGKLTLLAGATAQNQNNNYSSVFATGYSSDALLRSIESAATLQASGTPSAYRYAAAFGRASYNYDNRYLININGRRDGSSRFGPGRQFGNFGSVGAAWIFTNEAPLKDHRKVLSYGKLRGSYGTSGSDQIGNYQYLDSWRSTQNTYENTPGITPARLFNPDYGWEINRKLEGALDLGFLEDRILLSAVYYYNRSDNHLINYTLPAQTGFTSVTRNFPALIQNTGLELTLNTVNFKTASFGWASSINLTLPKNKLISFPGLSASSYADLFKEGKSLSLISGYEYIGVDPRTGALRFKDQDGDGQLSPNDYIDIGDYDPRFYGGIGNQVRYKSWSLDFFFDFKKQLNKNLLGYFYTTDHVPGFIGNLPVRFLDRWQQPGDGTDYSRLTASTASDAYKAISNGFSTTSGAYTMITYLRLKTLSLSYSVNGAWVNRLAVRSCRLYLSGQNLFTLSGYKDGDPDHTNPLMLPPLRTLTAGIELSL